MNEYYLPNSYWEKVPFPSPENVFWWEKGETGVSSSGIVTTNSLLSSRFPRGLCWSWQDPAAISVVPFGPVGQLGQGWCINPRLDFHTDYNYRVPYTEWNEGRRTERPTSGVFTLPRGPLEAKIVLRFQGKGGQSKNGKENTPTQKVTINSLRKHWVFIF